MPARLNTAAAIVLTFAAASVLTAQQTQLEASDTVFTVMAALNAAGWDHGLATSHPLRNAVRVELAKKKIEVLPEIQKFVREHRQDDPAADLAQYVSFALSVKGAPDFESRFRTNEIPPDVAAMQGFDNLMVRFYRDANIPELWQRAQGNVNKELERYHGPVSEGVLQAQGYLRHVATRTEHGEFRVYLDLLGPANQVHTRSYKGDMLLVVTPAVEPQQQDVRHAYLHFQLDPLAVRYADVVNRKKALAEAAAGAPLLAGGFKEDFLLLVTESLVKAIEVRLAKPGDRSALVSDALGEGYILTPYFSEALPKYEKQAQSMRFFYPELVTGIDVKDENARLAQVKFATERKPRPAPPPLQAAPQQTLSEKTLDEADDLYKGRELDQARTAYLKVLQSGDAILHARAYYGLARIAALEKSPSLAEELFRKALDSTPDPQTRAWTEIYLGRLAAASRDSQPEAEAHFRNALAIDGATEAARKAADQELKRLAGKP